VQVRQSGVHTLVESYPSATTPASATASPHAEIGGRRSYVHSRQRRRGDYGHYEYPNAAKFLYQNEDRLPALAVGWRPV
jgi:hypothetical protein